MSMNIARQISDERQQELGVGEWSPWSKSVSQFDWTYDGTETCFILEGEVTVTTESGESVTAEEGDLIQFQDGLNCTWDITRDLRKVFTFEPVVIKTNEAPISE